MGPAVQTAVSQQAPSSTALRRLAWAPVGGVVLVDGALLVAMLTGYGYNRDELYFRMLAAHPSWGYVDQGPFTPLLARVGMAVLGDNLWALRIPAMLLALTAVFLTALIARELGGGAPAQTFAAAGVSSSFLFVAGHVLLTATPDIVVWLLVILFCARALNRGQPRWWLAVGLTVGLGLYDKQLVIGLVAGLAVAGPRRALLDRWLWAGALVALVVGLPNLVYQIVQGWPEITMAGVISADKGHDDRILFLPFQLVLLGFTVVPIWFAGLLHLFRDVRFRRVRALAWAYPVVAVLVVITGGQPYYTFGLLVFALAAGCVVVERWAQGRTWRLVWSVAAVAASFVFAVVLALPVIPVQSLPGAIPAINQTARDSIGWPAYVSEVARVYRSLPADDRSHTGLLAGNYGEAGALDLFGPAQGLPQVYSGHNELFRYGPPPSSVTIAVVVGIDDPAAEFHSCTVMAHLDNLVGIANEEQGRTIEVCRGPVGPWSQIWPQFQHFG